MLTAQAHNWTRLFLLLRILIIKTGAALSESGLSLFLSSFSDFSSFFFVVAKLKIQKKRQTGLFSWPRWESESALIERGGECVGVCEWGGGAGRHRHTGGTHSITKLCEVNEFNNVRKAI